MSRSQYIFEYSYIVNVRKTRDTHFRFHVVNSNWRTENFCHLARPIFARCVQLLMLATCVLHVGDAYANTRSKGAKKKKRMIFPIGYDICFKTLLVDLRSNVPSGSGSVAQWLPSAYSSNNPNFQCKHPTRSLPSLSLQTAGAVSSPAFLTHIWPVYSFLLPLDNLVVLIYEHTQLLFSFFFSLFLYHLSLLRLA